MRIQRYIFTREFWAYATPGGIASLLFVGDLLIPRGATPAIGYCVVPVLAAGVRRRDFMIGITIICTFLTWLGYLLEPPGAAEWMSVFDRAMITGAVWLIFRLAWRRREALAALACQTRALEKTKLELQRSNAELDSFASVVAHDIRGPLNTIGLFSQLLADGKSPNSDVESEQCKTSIQQEVTALSDLIQSLLAYGRVGGSEVRLRPCNCHALLDSVRQKLTSLIEGSGAQVTNDPLPTLAADPVLLAELFQNLIENGIKYRGTDAPRIRVSAHQYSEGWRFSVCDNGMGINGGDLKRIFQPFRQVGHGGPHRGVGLGLATCKRIVERHGGCIEVESTVGRGSIFTFTIPVHAIAERPQEALDGSR